MYGIAYSVRSGACCRWSFLHVPSFNVDVLCGGEREGERGRELCGSVVFGEIGTRLWLMGCCSLCIEVH